MAGGEDEAVAVEPLIVLRVVFEVLGPEDVGHGGRAHRQPGMPGIRLLNGIDRQHLDRVD